MELNAPASKFFCQPLQIFFSSPRSATLERYLFGAIENLFCAIENLFCATTVTLVIFSFFLQAIYQSQLVKCCQSMMNVCGTGCLEVSQQIFHVLVTVLALAASDDVAGTAQGSFYYEVVSFV